MGAGDNRDMRCRSAFGADQARQAAKRRADQVESRDIVRDDDRTRWCLGKPGIALAEQCQGDLPGDGAQVFAAGAQIRIVQGLELPCQAGTGVERRADRILASPYGGIEQRQESLVAPDVVERCGDRELFGIGLRLVLSTRQTGLDCGKRAVEAGDFAVDLMGRDGAGRRFERFWKERESRADAAAFAGGRAAQNQIFRIGRGKLRLLRCGRVRFLQA